MITRSEVIERARTLWRPGSVPYSQNTIHGPTGYRQDCSGYVSMCWGIPPSENGGWGGQSTVTLVTRGYMREIPPAELRPGDAVGICGPDTAGDAGHIVLFERWVNDDPSNDDYWLWEQAGGRSGPVWRMLTYPYGGPWGQWKAYRFKDIVDVNPLPESGGVIMGDYAPLGAPEMVKLNGVTRGDSVMIADIWGHVMAGHSPWSTQRSHIGAQLDRIEAAIKAAALSPEMIQSLASAVAEAVTQDASAEDIAREIIAQLSKQSQQ